MQEADPMDIPPEWRMWTRGILEQPPTQEQIARSKAQRLETRRRGIEFDIEDSKLLKEKEKVDPSKISMSTWDPNAKSS